MAVCIEKEGPSYKKIGNPMKQIYYPMKTSSNPLCKAERLLCNSQLVGIAGIVFLELRFSTASDFSGSGHGLESAEFSSEPTGETTEIFRKFQ